MKSDIFKALSMITYVGISVAVPIILCVAVSGWLCRRFSLGSWVVIAGAFLGAAAGFSNLFKLAKIMNKEDK